jgi:hypothetical protein
VTIDSDNQDYNREAKLAEYRERQSVAFDLPDPLGQTNGITIFPYDEQEKECDAHCMRRTRHKVIPIRTNDDDKIYYLGFICAQRVIAPNTKFMTGNQNIALANLRDYAEAHNVTASLFRASLNELKAHYDLVKEEQAANRAQRKRARRRKPKP